MTPEVLEELILETKDTQKLVLAFSSLSDEERSALSTTASKLKSQLERNWPNKGASDLLIKHLAKYKDSWDSWRSIENNNASIALFALCPISAIKKHDISLDNEQALEQVVLDRKPSWLDEWLAYELEQELPVISFSTLRRWIKAGTCNKPTVSGYYTVFASDLMHIEHRKGRPQKLPISQQLLNDPDLLEDVWQLFEIENQAFNTESWLTANAPDDYETWSEALIKLSNDGYLERNRLLGASLKGLHQDVKQNQLSGMHKFHEQLKPTKDERMAHQSEYISLLSHQVGHVAKFALKMISVLEKDRLLDKQAFLSEVQAVFFQEAKGNAVSALKLIKRMMKHGPDTLDLALKAVTEALRHSNVDVQSMAFELLKEHEKKLSDVVKSEIVNHAGYVASSLKSKLLLLVGDQSHLSEPTHLIDHKFEYQNISKNILDHSILATVEPLKPIQCVDELIGAVSHAIEIVETPDDLELILDGISRLCAEKTDDFEQKVAPLLYRITEGGGLETREGIAGAFGGFKIAIKDLLLSWITGEKHFTPISQGYKPKSQLKVAVTHVGSITRRVVNQQAQPLISAPTHSGGWIEPVTWIKRLVKADKQNITFGGMDLSLSLLRLAPDKRDEALQICMELSPNIKRLAMFALGGDEKPTYADRENYDIWISAARCRDPQADWTDIFAPLKLKDEWADSIRPAVYAWKAYQKVHQNTYNYGGEETVETFKTPSIDVKVKIAVDIEKKNNSLLSKVGDIISRDLQTDWKLLPSAALNHHEEHEYAYESNIDTTWLVHWLMYLWPLSPDGAYIRGIKQQIWRIDMDGSNWEPAFGFFYGLFQKNRPWSEPAHLLLSLGLVAKDADSRGLAIDAFIAGVDNRCLDIDVLTNTLTHLSHGEVLKLNRLADNLLQISQASLLHAYVVVEIIQKWLLSVDIQQRNIFRVLEVLLEGQATIKLMLRLEVCDLLRQIKGSSKAAKLAKQLIAEYG